MPGNKTSGGKTPGGKTPDGKRTKDGPSELLDYVVAYAKQETLDPVVRQAKSLAKGLAGAVLFALGTVLLAIGFVRALQGEFGSAASGAGAGPSTSPYGSGHPLSGDWSWVPYMGGAIFCMLVTVFCVVRVFRGHDR